MFEDSNTITQPLKDMTIFNNWNAVVEAWYCVGEVSSLKKKNIFGTQVGKQQLVVFRTSEGKIHCLDAFCSHMGLNLSLGTVVKDQLRCHFHHWGFSGNGECSKLNNKNLNSYPVEVRYGLIWIWAGKESKYPLPLHQDLLENYSFKLGPLYKRPSHPHISLLNALDVQHVNTVHALDMQVTAKHHEAPDQSYIHYDFEGKFLETSKTGRRNARMSGGGYRFSVRYASATVGFLKALEGIKLFGKFPFPPIYATFGYRPINQNQTAIQPIFLTKKRAGLMGGLKSWLHLTMTEFIYNRLKNEDGEIYENIRFTPNLTSEDSNITSFIAHVNRLPKSQF